jgi:XTP/dITP diphosphohydrolase
VTSLLVATTNPGKLREIAVALAGAPVRLLALGDLAPIPEPAETEPTFRGNALLKARFYAARAALLTVAEDSGLAIDALDGRPGVESARYPGATYPDKFANLYRELAPHARPWTARYVCAVVVVNPAAGDDDVIYTGEATVDGEIADRPRGTHGFGYDPIFFYPPYGRTLGEVSDAEKLVVSHRGKAFRDLHDWLTAR